MIDFFKDSTRLPVQTQPPSEGARAKVGSFWDICTASVYDERIVGGSIDSIVQLILTDVVGSISRTTSNEMRCHL
jgi:hypothetical protein